MLKTKVIKGLLGAIAAAALLGALTAKAQTTKPPVTGEPTDHTSPGAVARPDAKAKPMTTTTKPGVKPPVTGEPEDHTSRGAAPRPAGTMRLLAREAASHLLPGSNGRRR